MKNCLIISAGEFAPLPEDLTYDFVIACDAGYRHALRMGIRPDFVIGDFDSGDKPDDPTIPIETFPCEKDDTDTMLAIRYAMNHGAETVILSCALGGRFDHTFSNIQSLAFAAAHGMRACLTGKGEWMETCTGGSEPLLLPKRKGHSLSLFALTDRCTGLTIKGAKYSAENIELTNTFPIGESNKWEEDVVTITIDSGILLVVESAEKGL